jgi:polysaccharide transporter, PST family
LPAGKYERQQGGDPDRQIQMNRAGEMVRQSFLNRLMTHPGVRNFAWLACDKVARVGVSIFVVSWTARHLGIAEFGLLSYVTVWVAIVSNVAALGMDALVVRDFIHRPAESNQLLGTVLLFRGTACAIFAVLAALACLFLRADEPRAAWFVAILALGAVFQSLEAGELYFQARLQMRLLVLPRLALFLGINILKLILISRGAGISAFVVITAIEFAAGGLLTFGLVRWSREGLGTLTISGAKGWQLLQECYPLALSGLVVVLYTRITSLLISGLLDDAALGVYTAATRITEATYFVAGILASSLLPSLLRQRDLGDAAYRAARLRFFRINAALAFLVIVPLSLAAPWLMGALYGSNYAEAALVLRVHAWTILFAFLGVARGQHFLNERQTGWALRFSVWGLILNVLLCATLIPRYRLHGAAWSVVIAYAVSAVGTSFLHSGARSVGREQVWAILTPWKIS